MTHVPPRPRLCVVNVDDFGACAGVNEAVVDLHHRGVVSSASLMVDMPGAAAAARVARNEPGLSLGLHASLTYEDGRPRFDLGDAMACRVEVRRQASLFMTLVGRPPTHVDSHHNVHRTEPLAGVFRDLAEDLGVPLRGQGPIRYVPSFYGQWGGETHPEQVSPTGLRRILRTEVVAAINELACHPGYPCPDFATPYDRERQLELETLAHPEALEWFDAEGIEIVGFHDSRIRGLRTARQAS